MAVKMYDTATLTGKYVEVNCGGPNAVKGILQSVQPDYLVVLDKNGTIVYVNDTHIKSVKDTETSTAQDIKTDYITASNFSGVVEELQYSSVRVNRGGTQELTGMIVDVDRKDLVMNINNKEVVRIPVNRVRSITVLSSKNNLSRGNLSHGSRSHGSLSRGNLSHGSLSHGNLSHGNLSHGNLSRGNHSHGNLSRGNLSHGNSSRGSHSWGSWSDDSWTETDCSPGKKTPRKRRAHKRRPKNKRVTSRCRSKKCNFR